MKGPHKKPNETLSCGIIAFWEDETRKPNRIIVKYPCCGFTKEISTSTLGSLRKPRATGRCLECSKAYQRGPNHPLWRGGKRWVNGGEYIAISFFHIPESARDIIAPMIDRSGYILEHRAVMAIHLGRSLRSDEQVHHKNGIKHDNRIENLEVLEPAKHTAEHKAMVKLLAINEARLHEIEARLSDLEKR